MIRRTEATIHPRTSCPCGLAFDRYRLALGQKRLFAGDEHVREPPFRGCRTLARSDKVCRIALGV